MGVVLGIGFSARLGVLFWYGRLDKGSESLKETVFGAEVLVTSPCFSRRERQSGQFGSGGVHSIRAGGAWSTNGRRNTRIWSAQCRH